MRAVTGLKHAARAPEGVGLGCGLGDMRTKLSDNTYQSAFGIPISVSWHYPAKTTLGGGTYQSTYPAVEVGGVG